MSQDKNSNLKIIIPPNAPDPNQFGGFLVWQIGNKWERLINSYLKIHNVSQGEFFHMVCLWQLESNILNSNKEVTQTDLAKACGTTPMNTSKTLRSLSKKSFITRVEGQDSRSKAIHLTQNGKQVCIESTKDIALAHKEFFGELQHPTTLQILQTLNQNN